MSQTPNRNLSRRDLYEAAQSRNQIALGYWRRSFADLKNKAPAVQGQRSEDAKNNQHRKITTDDGRSHG